MEATYSIKQASEKTSLSEHTLRYYDRAGLLPLIKRSPGGIRKFTEEDIGWIGLICCLKNSGMPISEIKAFMDLCLQGDTFEQRREILEHHREYILAQMEQLKQSLQTVEYKIEHYRQIGIFHVDAAGRQAQ